MEVAQNAKGVVMIEAVESMIRKRRRKDGNLEKPHGLGTLFFATRQDSDIDGRRRNNSHPTSSTRPDSPYHRFTRGVEAFSNNISSLRT